MRKKIVEKIPNSIVDDALSFDHQLLDWSVGWPTSLVYLGQVLLLLLLLLFFLFKIECSRRAQESERK